MFAIRLFGKTNQHHTPGMNPSICVRPFMAAQTNGNLDSRLRMGFGGTAIAGGEKDVFVLDSIYQRLNASVDRIDVTAETTGIAALLSDGLGWLDGVFAADESPNHRMHQSQCGRWKP